MISKANTALLVITYIRAEALNRSLTYVFRHLNGAPIDVIISQDADDSHVSNIIRDFNHLHNLTHIQHKDRIPPHDLKAGEIVGYYYISQHYSFALSYVFKQGYDYVIILEEDLEIAPDFFSYFLKTRELLDKDKTLYCVSAWNDNGRNSLVRNKEQLYRTDIFPGLGWMMSKELWLELGSRWPDAYWDDWLREPSQRQGRSCIFPEISRTYTFGLKDGISQGQFAEQYLKPIVLNDEYIDWFSIDLSFLLKQNYDTDFIELLQTTRTVSQKEVDNYNDENLYIEFKKGAHAAICRHFGLMPDEKSGLLRTSYSNVVMFWRGTNRIFLAPEGTKEQLINNYNNLSNTVHTEQIT